MCPARRGFVLLLTSCALVVSQPRPVNGALHAVAEARSIALGDGPPGAVINIDSGATSASASYLGPSHVFDGFTPVTRGIVSSSAFAEIAPDGSLGLGVFARSFLDNETLGASAGAIAQWTDTWRWNAASGLPQPSEILLSFEIEGAIAHDGGDMSIVRLGVDINHGSKSANYRSQEIGEVPTVFSNGWDASILPPFPAGISFIVPVGPAGEASWHVRMTLDAIVAPLHFGDKGTALAVGDFQNTLTLAAVSLPDGTPFEMGGTFESGILPKSAIVPNSAAVPEPLSLLVWTGFIGLAATAIAICRKRRQYGGLLHTKDVVASVRQEVFCAR